MARTQRRVLTGLVAGALLAAGCTLPVYAPNTDGAAEGDPSPGPAASGEAAIWRPCPDVPEDLVGRSAPGMRYECASVAVPQDWADPGGSGTFEIALLRARSNRQQDRIGSLVVNPGGPGGSGIDTAVYLSFGAAFGGLPDEITERFDIVGFDPRGVARSSPVECISDADLDATFGADPDPDTQGEFDEVVAINKRVGDGCGAKYGDRLTLFSTEQAARDMDAVRAAVGDEKLTYLGYSYGTLLGATYAQLFPSKIRALVLDGAVDPGQDMVAGSESQAKGFERAFTNFTNWCEQTRGRCPIGPDARGAVTDAIEKARVSPVRGSDGREATAGWVFYAVISSLYTEQGWQELATAVDDLRRGDAAAVFELADSYAERDSGGHYSNLFDANLAVNCADSTAKPTLKQVRSYQSQWRAKYPLFGAALAVGMLPCAYWPGERDPYPTGEAKGAPPIVVVGTTGDPATPYEQTAKLADMLGVGVVLTWEGEGHTAYPQTECVTRAVDRYLIDLEAPQAGLRCPR
ncbi:alpha/beta hydrolase [Phytohabitans sp. ZYX-F-186]|uniref:Alpha/beta hydrolase n=1 Tax=Phytohabitans maris TaxID=3071409 RepID=A0ABU0ZJX8_9ACTN|nr:alpha/beta hydrolase [Phytohabitans sp. ZYX-F-186]MDQ7906575.1 alpha/beta hydrolase [Phytohabitans sp. ZYX-F-186]